MGTGLGASPVESTMDGSFWKGVIVGVGGLLLLSMFMSIWGWVPWLLLGAGGAYAYYRFSNKQPPSLSDPASKVREIADEVDKRIDELRNRR